jgi:hypothetical protein
MESVQKSRDQTDISIPLRLAVAFLEPVGLLALHVPTCRTLVISDIKTLEYSFFKNLEGAGATHPAGNVIFDILHVIGFS